MIASNNNLLKNLSKILIIIHFIVSFLINYFTNTYPDGFLGILGAIAFIIGNQIIVLISYFLLYYNKIKKIGTQVSIGLQILASIGGYASFLVNYSNLYLVFSFLFSILFNALYIVSMILLLNHNERSIKESEAALDYSVLADSNTDITFCGKCGNKVNSGSNFCNKCGNRISWEKKEPMKAIKCNHCCKKVPQDSQFCPFCGAKIDQEIAAHSPEKTKSSNAVNCAINRNQSHYSFINISNDSPSNFKQKLKHLEIPNNESILMIGDIYKSPLSYKCWLINFIVYLSYFVFLLLTRDNYGKNVYHLWLPLPSYRGEIFSGNFRLKLGILLLLLITTCIVLIPIIIEHLILKQKTNVELVLTDKHICLYIPSNPGITQIPINSISSIDLKSCNWGRGASQITITLINGTRFSISLLYNAQEFIEKCISSAKNINS